MQNREWSSDFGNIPEQQPLWLAIEYYAGPDVYHYVARGYYVPKDATFYFEDGTEITGEVNHWMKTEPEPKYPE